MLEIYNGIPRGGFDPGAELTAALKLLRSARGRLRLGALLCYDALAAGASDVPTRKTAAQFAQKQPDPAYESVVAHARDFVDLRTFIRNGPGSSNYPYWAGTKAANEFSAGSAVLFANYLDAYDTSKGFAKGLYLCAPVLRLPENMFLGKGPFPIPPGTEPVYIKSGGWPTGNNPTLSKLCIRRDCSRGRLRPRLERVGPDPRAQRAAPARRLRGRDGAAGHGGPGLLWRPVRSPRRPGPSAVADRVALGRPARGARLRLTTAEAPAAAAIGRVEHGGRWAHQAGPDRGSRSARGRHRRKGSDGGRDRGVADPAFPSALGSGGRPTTNEALAALAREHGSGEP